MVLGMMKKENKKRKITAMHETFRGAGLLAFVGGFLDAYTYVVRGGVFANAQTGNMVLLGIHAAQGKYLKAGYCLIPITAFAIGVFVTEALKRFFTRKEFTVFEHWIIAIEAIILLAIGFMPLTVPDAVVNVLVSFVCSLQVNGFRKVRGLTYASTMCTGNLRSGMELLSRYVLEGEQKARGTAVYYFGIIMLFVFGAASGTVLTGAWGKESVWVAAFVLIVLFAVMCSKRK